MTEQGSEYDRGHTAARMSNYDAHFERLNGSMDRTADVLTGLTLAVQQLRDQHKSDAETRLATASALKDAADALRTQTDQRWSPVSKRLAVVSMIVTVMMMGLTAWALLRH